MTRDRDDPADYERLLARSPGRYRAVCTVPGDLFNEGRFVMGLNVGIPGVRRLFQDENALAFHVDMTGGVGSQWPPQDTSGFFRPRLGWGTECLRS